jgi:activator of HSP90 ATPase
MALEVHPSRERRCVVAAETISVNRILPATARRIYAAWLDPADHAAMTGGAATGEAARVGARFTAWDGYIAGRHLALEPGRRIVQAWRSTDFPADAADSRLEVRLTRAAGGTRVTIRHGGIPVGQGPGYLEGWGEYYLDPMQRFFAAERRRARARAAMRKRRASRRPASRSRRRRT